MKRIFKASRAFEAEDRQSYKSKILNGLNVQNYRMKIMSIECLNRI